MLRTIPLFLLALSLGSTLAQAGLYGGFGAGSDFVDFSARSHIIKNEPNQPVEFNVLNVSHAAATGGFGTIFAGYGNMVGQNLYLAVEVNGNLSATRAPSLNHEYVHNNFSNTYLKIKNSIGVSLIPGYQLTPNTLFYIRLGITNSRITQKTSDTSLAHFRINQDGFRYGLGVKQDLNDRFAVRMDYSIVNYKHDVTGTYDAGSFVAKATSLKPIEQLVEFSVIVKFA